jgi:ATP-binding cassette subfamily B protein
VFNNVSFEYTPGQLVLNDISFSIKNGSSVAIVGTSGSGKSTLLKLIMRIIEPNMGSISYDGVNLDLASVASIRRHSSMVLQESHVLRGTIAENIRYGSDSIGDERLYEAAKMAGIHDFITQLPLGYHTVINDRGSSLSGGQRQRIAIARAFAHDLPMLFLDEPTSMLDPINEAAINETFIELADGRTVILVSHRLAISRDFDKILVLDKGKLIEEGNHHELMAMGGFYRTMWDKQNGFMISSEGSAKITPARLRMIPIFSNLELEVLADLAAQFDSEAFEPGVRIIQEGAQGDKFYIAVRGNLKVLKKDSEGRDVELAVLSDGDHFGEIALMKSVARTASIEALSHTSCLSLSRERFKRLVETQPELFKVLTDAMSARITA